MSRPINMVSNSDKDLPLTKGQYFELIELLIFYVILPEKGMKESK